MRRIKLFLTHNEYIDEYESRRVLSEGISNWEEVSDEDYEFIIQNKHHIMGHFNQNIVLIEEYTNPFPSLILNIKEKIQKEIDYEKRRIEKEKEARLAKSKLSAAKKLERAKARIAELEVLVQKEESQNG